MAKFKIVSDGTVVGTRVWADGVDISETISSITWKMDATNRGPHVTIETTPRVDLDVEAEVNG